MNGSIYLIPSLLGSSDPRYVIPEGVIKIMHTLNHFVVENTRTSRRFLIKTGHPLSPDEILFYELDKNHPRAGIEDYINLCLSGINLGIISEAGIPGIADPGSVLVKSAHEKGLKIIPLSGPSSIFLALSASGMNGQNFVFHGYLPVKSAERIKRIREIEQDSVRERQTQIFIETPYRNMSLLSDLIKVCKSATLLCIASEMTTAQEFIRTKSISSWKKQLPDLLKRPCVFLLQS